MPNQETCYRLGRLGQQEITKLMTMLKGALGEGFKSLKIVSFYKH